MLGGKVVRFFMLNTMTHSMHAQLQHGTSQFFLFPEPPWDEFDVLQMLKFDACQATIFFMKGHMGG